MSRQTTPLLSSTRLPWLLALALALAPVLQPVLHLVPTAHAQSRIDELKGEKGENARSDDIPAGRSGYAFGIGAGADTDGLRPSSYSRKLPIGANFNAGFGYSCGQFNIYDNIEAMLEQTVEKFKQIPQMFVMAVQGAVASLPAYLLNKINPTLYNVINKNLDEAFKLFEVNFKDCQQIEREIALGQNPYHSLVMAGIGDRMRVEMGFGSGTIDERMKVVRQQGPANGVVMSDGQRYGGEGQDPIKVTENVLTSGINLLTDRGVSNTGSFSSEMHAQHPITQAFASPKELIDFITDIYGSQAFMLTKEGPAQSKPGYGYQKKYVELRDQTIEHLQRYVFKEIDRPAFEKASGLLIPPATVEELRRLSHYEQSIAIDDQARTHAVTQLRLKYDFALQALRTGLQEPNLAQSEAYEVFEREITQLMIAMQEDMAHLIGVTFLR